MKLKKSLGAIEIFSIATGAMISSGLFILPGLAFAKCGPAVILAYLLAGIIIIPSMLSKAELATAMPKSGGDYFFIERSMGPWAGTLGGLAAWFSLSFKSAFALAGMGAFGILLVPHITEFQMDMIAISFCILFTVVNLVSVKHAGKLQVYLVFFLLAILCLFAAFGIERINLDFYKDFNPHGMKAVFATVGLIFVSFGGITKVASVAEETKNPGRNIPRGMITSFIVVTLFYVIVVGITVGVLAGDQLSGSLIPISLAARVFMGTPGLLILSVAALIAFITTANAGILSASRAPLAMSIDNLLPPLFKKISPRHKTPTISILATSGFMICVILFLDLENLVKTASTMKILLFMTVNLSVIIMRESRIHSYRPLFRAPLYPWLQIAAVIVYAFLIFEMGLIPLFITGSFVVLGTLWYFIYARPRVKRRSALMHVVRRVTAKEMVHPTLESELKDILVERDLIIEDRFDRLVKECPIVDFEEEVSSLKAFRTIARVLAPILKMEEDKLYDLFLKREAQSSTVIRPGLAIPHVLIEGEKIFHLLLARSKKGITFAGAEKPVHSMFVLIGTMDERNYHLRALMAIAQISQSPKFDKRWLNARGKEELRNIILLARRQRGVD
ncbi:MAG: amino acid permease [Candidatus Tritonobacter lacicola]|nr:amino acid permease [Candidatus Tritonobacter lacicola]